MFQTKNDNLYDIKTLNIALYLSFVWWCVRRYLTCYLDKHKKIVFFKFFINNLDKQLIYTVETNRVDYNTCETKLKEKM